MNIPDNALDARASSLNWSGTQGGAGAAACYGGHIQYALRDSSSMLTLLTSDLSAYQSSGQFSDINNWVSTSAASGFPTSLRSKFQVERFITMASLGDYNYVFWVNAAGEYMALRSRPDMLEPVAITRLDFAPVGDNAALTSNLGVMALPDALPALEGKLGLVGLGTQTINGTAMGFLFSYVLDPADFAANSTWPVSSLNGGYFAKIGNMLGSVSAGVSFVQRYTDLCASWVNRGTSAASPGETPQANFILVVNCHRESSGSPGCYSFGLDLLRCFDAMYSIERFNSPQVPDPVPISNLDKTAEGAGATLCQAPDGSLLTHYIDDDSAVVRIASFVPNTAPAGSANYGKPGLYQPTWQHSSKDPDGSSTSIPAHNTPCAVFVPLAATLGASPCVLPLQDGSGHSSIIQGCTVQKYVQCIFSSDSSHKVVLSTFYWGSLFSVPNYVVSSVSPGYQETVLLSTVADTFPYPVPLASVWGADSPSGMVNWLLCTYEYLVGNQTAVDLSYNLSAGIGFKAETTDTFVVGLKTETSLSAGFSMLASATSTSFRASALSVTTKGLPYEEEPAADAKLRIASEGQLYGSTPPAHIGVDLCAVLLRGANKISGPTVRTVHPIFDSSPVAIAGDFLTYCSIPGKLSSYLDDSIDKTMVRLFSQLSDTEQEDFIINGEDFRSYYQSDDQSGYTKKIIQRFGSNTFGPSGNLPYLEFSFSETGIQRSEFQSTSGFTVGGGAYVNGSAYAGLAWEQVDSVEVGLFGVLDVELEGVDSEGYIMAGVEFSTSLVSTYSSTDSWGIRLGEYLNPLAPGEAYTVRLYLLQPSPLWAAELKHFGFPHSAYPTPPNIDLVNSAPMRIFFTVPYISPVLLARE